MRDPSPELVAEVRRRARTWGARHRLRWADIEDLEGELLAWLVEYEPPSGWYENGAVLHQLPWRLVDCARRALRSKGATRQDISIDPVDATTIGTTLDHGAEPDPGYAQVDLELLLDTIPNPDERQALIAWATHGDAKALADRLGLDLSTIHKRAGRARAHVLAALEAS